MNHYVKYHLFILLFISLKINGQTINFNGRLKLSDSSNYAKVIGFTEVRLEWYNSVDSTFDLMTTEIDSNLKFAFRNVRGSDPKIFICNYFHSTDTCHKTFFLQNFGFQDTVISKYHLLPGDNYIELYYPPLCKHQSNKCNNICPTCKKSDMTIPILYGLPLENIDGSFGPKYEYYEAGCDVKKCGPYWHCKRDKVEF